MSFSWKGNTYKHIQGKDKGNNVHHWLLYKFYFDVSFRTLKGYSLPGILPPELAKLPYLTVM